MICAFSTFMKLINLMFFQTYDYMRTQKLKKEHIFPTMRGCLIKLQNDENPDEAVKVQLNVIINELTNLFIDTKILLLQDLIDMLIRKLDVDRDGAVSKEDFKTAVKERNELLLECMGPVFPTKEACHVFLSTFTDDLGRY